MSKLLVSISFTCAIAFLLAVAHAGGAVRTWSGGGGDNNWNSAANWGGTVPVDGDSLVFNGSTQQNNTNNVANLTNNWVTFNNGGFVLNGNLLTLNGAAGQITNALGLNIVNLPLQVAAGDNNATWSIAAGSEVRLVNLLTNASSANPLANLVGGGTLRLASNTVNSTRMITTYNGTLIDDGAEVVITNDGFRFSPTSASSTAACVITNNGFIQIGGNSSMRLGQLQGGLAAGTVLVNVSSGEILLQPGGDNGAPSYGGCITLGENPNVTATFNQNGGLVWLNPLASVGTATDLNAGNLIYGANAAGGSGTYNLNGGILLVRSLVNAHAGGTQVFNFNGGTLKPVASTGVFMPNAFTANVQAGGAIIDTTNLNITIAQALGAGSPGGGLTKLGTGTLTLSGSSTYTGTTIVSNGTLAVTTSSLAGGGALVVADGATLSLTNAGSTMDLASLTMGSSTTNTLQFNFPDGNIGSASLSTGGFTGNGYVAIKIIGSGLAPGTIPLVDYSSASGLGNIHLAYVPPGVVASLSTTGGVINLVITSSGKSLDWTGAVNANWDTMTLNWADLGNGNNPTNFSQPGGFGDLVTFDDTLSANPDINLAQSVSPVIMTLNNNAYAYTFTGPGMISGVGNVVKGGFQSVTFGTQNSYSGGTTLNAGIIYVGADQALGTGPATLNLGTLASDGTTARTLSNSIIQNASTGVIFGDTVNTGTLNLEGGLNLAGAAPTLDFNSDVNISGGLTNGGIGTKTGPGTLIVSGPGLINAQTTQTGGNTLINGGSLVQVGDGWRMQDTVTGSTMDFAVTNGGSFIMTNLVGGNFRLGLAGEDTSTSYILDVAGTMIVYAAAGPGAAGNVYLGSAAQQATLNLWPGGILICGQLTSGGTSISEVDCYGGTLKPTFNSTTFFQGVTNAFIQNGGLTVDTTNLNVTIAQPLLAAGSGGLTKTGSGTLNLSGASTYTGATAVNAGKLVLGTAFASPSAITIHANSTLAFQQSGTNAVDVVSVTAGSGASSAIEADLAVTNEPAGVITNLVLNGPVEVNVAGALGIGQFPLFGYVTISGSGGLTLGTIPEGTIGHLVTNTLAHTIDIVISGVAQTVWIGNLSGNWDTVTTNWTLSSSPVAYAQNANVLFNDSASDFAVSLVGSLTPSTMVLSNAAQSYTFSGSGNLGGNMTLVKYGTNSAIFSTVNSYSGATTVKAGTLLAGADTTLGSGTIYVTNGGALDLSLPTADDPNAIALQPVVVSGSGVSGTGALLNSSATSENNAYRNVTLAGDTTIGCASILGLRTTANTDPGLIANGHKLTKLGTGQFNLNGGTTVSNITTFWFGDIGNIDIQQGILSFERHASLGNPTNTITVESGATLQLFSLNPTNPVPITNSVVMNNAALEGTGATAGDTNTLGCPITLNGTSNVISSTASTYLVLNGPIIGTGSVEFSGTNQLGGNDAYTGSTVLSDGVLSVGSGASLAGTALINTLAGSTLDVSALSPWTLGTAQTLGGAGTVNGSVEADGTLAPGSGTGTLAINGNLTLNGNLLFEVDKALTQSNDMASASGTLGNTGTGALTVTNLDSGLPLAVGDRFTLFNQPVANGGAIIITGGGVTWTNNLAVDGSIGVVAVLPVGPTNSEPIAVASSAGNLKLSWRTIGWRLLVQTNSLSKGLGTNWVSWPNANTTNALNIPVTRTNPAVFFRLVYP